MNTLRLCLAASLVAASIGWIANGIRLGATLSGLQAEHAQHLGRIAATQAATIAEQSRIRDHLMRQLAAIDEQRHQELQNAQTATDTLAADLAAARQRLRVRVDPASCPGLSPAAPTSGLDDDAGARADIHPADAADLVRVTGRADECRVRLSALQDWARTVSER